MTKLPPPLNRLEQIKAAASEGHQGYSLSNEGRKLLVHIGQIDEDPKNERRSFNDHSLSGLAASIRQFGIVEPPTAFELDGGRYQLITGHRRFRGAKLAGLEKIEIIIRKADEEKTIRKKSIVTNIQREDVNPIEMANALQALLDDQEVETQSALAETVGKDKTWVSKMLRILKLPAELQEKVAMSQLLVSYDAVAEIARVPDAKKQGRLVDFLLNGASVQDVRQQIRTAKEGGELSTQSNGSGTKPKYVFSTKQNAKVIIQSLGDELSKEEQIQALRDALKMASKASE